MKRNRQLLALAVFTAMGVAVALAGDPPPQAAKPAPAPVVGGGQFSPYARQTLPNRVYWGVAHVHTTFSFDAGMFGTTLTPDDLFKAATGGEVVMDNGSASNRTDRWTGSPLPTMPSTWASPIRFELGIRRSWPSPGQAVVRHVQGGCSGGRAGRHRSGRYPRRAASRSSTPASSPPRPGRTPPRQPRNGTSRAFSRHCTASSGLPCPAAPTCIAPSFFATAQSA